MARKKVRPVKVKIGFDSFVLSKELYVDLSTATTATVDELRKAFELKSKLEGDK